MEKLALMTILLSVAVLYVVLAGNVACAAANDYIYTGTNYGNKLYVVEADNLSVVGNISVPGKAIDIVKASPDGKWIVAVNESYNYQYNIIIVNTTSNKVEHTFGTTYVYDLAFSGDSTRFYVLREGGVYIFNPASGNLQGSIGLKYPKDGSRLIAVSPDSNRVYVVTTHISGSYMPYNDYNITAYDAHSHEYLDHLRLSTTVNAIALSPDGSTIYAATSYIKQDTGGIKYTDSLVDVIKTADLSTTGTIGVGQNPRGVTFSRDGKKAYVANWDDGSVSIIDTASRKVIKTATVGGKPMEIAVAFDGKKVYVPCLGSSPSVIDTATDKVTTATIGGLDAVTFIVFGRVPSGLWYNPGLLAPGMNFSVVNLSTPTPTASPATPAPTAPPANGTGVPTPTPIPTIAATATPSPASPSSPFLVPLAAGAALLMLATRGRLKR